MSDAKIHNVDVPVDVPPSVLLSTADNPVQFRRSDGVEVTVRPDCLVFFYGSKRLHKVAIVKAEQVLDLADDATLSYMTTNGRSSCGFTG
jgi:hypothetical protein